ncbi:GAF domain-containing protein [Nitratireductor sp. ZSWI3]|uniref:GAF domain-containing protein n=1 Tax=Nitratireductor sp. ZSWI3 TaxID=2966359 RepID=UPI00214FD6DD|nr:GAF domain-containing protein [Nitratireductor sp. ZSWI3]MCR4265568.1 GAF domain-containing protein [Nitratireductor sp. ZSWI3]
MTLPISTTITRILRLQAQDNQPMRMFRAVEEACRDRFGFRLLTVLAYDPQRNDTWRAYSSDPQNYPRRARKPMGVTQWGQRVLHERKSWFGNGPEDIRWAYPDADLILSLGCEATANAPIVWNGRTLGALSINGSGEAYRPQMLGELELLASLLVAAMRDLDGCPSGHAAAG